jgi:hypothetical protein
VPGANYTFAPNSTLSGTDSTPAGKLSGITAPDTSALLILGIGDKLFINYAISFGAVGEYENTARAEGTGVESDTGTNDDDDVTITVEEDEEENPPPPPPPGPQEPGIDIDKEADRQSSVRPGTVVHYTLVITNTGEEVLRNISIHDDWLAGYGGTPEVSLTRDGGPPLQMTVGLYCVFDGAGGNITDFKDPGDAGAELLFTTTDAITIKYAVMLTAVGNNTNEATARGENMTGEPVDDEDDVTIRVETPPDTPNPPDPPDPPDAPPPEDPPGPPEDPQEPPETPEDPPEEEEIPEPPIPTIPGDSLVPGDGNSYMQVDEEGVPRGMWT